jgi:hypothetical protein
MMTSAITFPRVCDVLANVSDDEKKSRRERIARAHAKREATTEYMTQHHQHLLDVMTREMTTQLNYFFNDAGDIMDECDVEFIALQHDTTNFVLQSDIIRGALMRLFNGNIVPALQAAGWVCDVDSFECFFDGVVYRISGIVCC